MTRYRTTPAHHHGTPTSVGILIVQLGTPSHSTTQSVRRFLREFLSDPRVIEIPQLLWLPILYGAILPFRSGESAAKYQKIWTSQGSPLRVHTEEQSTALKKLLSISTRASNNLILTHAMRYGEPSIPDMLDHLHAKGCQNILVLPLYPQYAGSSTASVFDAVNQWSRSIRNVPGIRLVRHFHDDPGYIRALAIRVQEHWERQRIRLPTKLLISFHGIPRRSLDQGDPYYCECQKTARLLAQALGLTSESYQICFQSRFGRTEWLQPYTHEVLKQLGQQGAERVDVICPGFVADCLETLEEIGMEGRDIFLNAGGKEFHLIPCLNNHPQWITALNNIIIRHIQGLLVSPENDIALSHSLRRAISLGAPQ